MQDQISTINQPSQKQISNQNLSNNYSMPSQLAEAQQAMASLTKLLVEISNQLIYLRREFRGEALYQGDDGSQHWVQISKPVFVKIDFKTNKPLTKLENMPWGEQKTVYIPNDEAIDEVLSMLKFSGVNQVTPIAGISEDVYMDDLREFGCKLAGVLCLKQREWGIDKELLPMAQFKIKTIIQDARSLALEGRTLKAIQTTVQRIEQAIEGEKGLKKMMNPYA